MKDYAKGYFIAIIILIPILYLIDSSLFDAGYSIALYGIAMFTVLSILLYYFLRKSIFSPNKQLFLSITIANTLIKMVCSVGLLLIYKKIHNPIDGDFVLPFLIIYLVFTTFETWFMIRMADEKP